MADFLFLIGLVAAGSALGGVARFAVTAFVDRRADSPFPWGTLVVNGTGSFALGLAMAMPAVSATLASPAWLLGVAGFLGSYTTVSSFSLQTLMLARSGEPLRATANVAGSLVVCLGGAACGMALGAMLVAGGG